MTEYSQIDKEDYEKEFSEFCEQLLFRKFNLVVIFTGSCFELPLIYFLEDFTDIDCIKYSRNICAIKKDETARKDFKGKVLIIRSEGSHYGYARLHFKSNNMPYTYAMIPEQMPAVSQVLLERSDISTGSFPDSSYACKWLANFQGLSRDIVDAIWCPNWPEEANEWKRRERRNEWPLPETVTEIVSRGCFLVAKPHKESQFVGNEWRFSFSEAELVLIYTWNHVQMYIYHILRLIKSDVVRKCGGKKMTFLTTYHFKTLMFWACEEKPKEFWLPDNIESSVKDLILAMIEWLIEKHCRNYFMPGNNMLDHLPSSHDFEREVQLLINSVTRVDEYISNTVSVTKNGEHGRLREISVRIPSKLLFAVQLKMSLFHIVDPFRSGRPMYKLSSPIEKSHLFRSDLVKLFKCLKIHRFLGLAEDCEAKLDRMREMERSIDRYFKNAYEENIDGLTYIDISPMDNSHAIFAKLLEKTIDCSDSSESVIGSRHEAESNFVDRNSTRRELRNCGTESIEGSQVACIAEMLLSVINEQIVKPFFFHTAAYEANFYWTIYGEELNEVAVESHKHAMDICNKWISYAESINNSLTFKFGFGWQGIPIIISNGWSVIFDKFITVVLGFLSLVKSITNSRSQSNYKLSNEGTASYVIVHVYPLDFLSYINYQCNVHLKNNCELDSGFMHDMQNNIARMFLCAAVRISTKLHEQ